MVNTSHLVARFISTMVFSNIVNGTRFFLGIQTEAGGYQSQIAWYLGDIEVCAGGFATIVSNNYDSPCNIPIPIVGVGSEVYEFQGCGTGDALTVTLDGHLDMNCTYAPRFIECPFNVVENAQTWSCADAEG